MLLSTPTLLPNSRGCTYFSSAPAGNRHRRRHRAADCGFELFQAAPLSARCSSGAEASTSRSCSLYDMHDRLVPYEKAWAWQRQQLAESAAAAELGRDQDALFILQHTPVYTLGAGSSEKHLRFDPLLPPAPLYRTERGGEVTYHGPGQLVMYPVLNLQRHQADLHWYLRSLEEVVLRALVSASGLQGERVTGLTGVWLNGRKLAAIGVRARKWITYHGLALNVTTDLQPYLQIVPCGINDKAVGSVMLALEELKCTQNSWDDPSAAAQTSPPSLLVGAGAPVGAAYGAVTENASTLEVPANVLVDAAAGAIPHLDGLQMPRDGRDGRRKRMNLNPAAADKVLLGKYRNALLQAFSEVFDLNLQLSCRDWS